MIALPSDGIEAAFWAWDIRYLRRPEVPDGDVVLCEAGEGKLAGELALTKGLDEDVVLERLNRGSRAFVAWSCRDGIVSWVWASQGREYAPPLRMTLYFPPGDGYVWEGETLEHRRGTGVFPRLMEFTGWQMAQAGCSTLWGGILDSNLDSQRANGKVGFRPVLKLRASHGFAGTHLTFLPADYADPRLVEKAMRLTMAPGSAAEERGA